MCKLLVPVDVTLPVRLPVTFPSTAPVCIPDVLPVRSPANIPAIAPVPVIVGDVRVLLVRVCVPVSETRVASLLPIVEPPGKVSLLLAPTL